MFDAPKSSLAYAAAAIWAAIVLSCGREAPGQAVSALGMYALPESSIASAPPLIAYGEPPAATSPGPLARLVHNLQQSEGLPPFALADQTGRIQRYVEPVPGVDLEPYVGQIVVVRHDTGRTLLASQLELPPRPLHPLLEGGANVATSIPAPHPSGNVSRHGALVKGAQFVDNDDTTVELLVDSEELPAGKSALITQPIESIEPESVNSDGESFVLGPHLGGQEQVEAFDVGPLSGAHLDGHSHAFESYPGDYFGVEACPECGGFHEPTACEAYGAFGHAEMFRPQSKPCKLFADVEINFLRTHLPQSSVGKLSEKYEFSPRVIVGFRETGKIDGRVRYWTYDRDTPLLAGSSIRANFDVFDVEGTHSFAGRHSEVTIGAGFRLASIDLTDVEGRTAGCDLIGMTLSADGRAPLTVIHGCQIAAVYGARLSILGGDWGGPDGNDFTGGLVQDDNVVVHELLGGLDVSTRYRDVDVHARLGFELQIWHSDALSQNAGTDSIGFLGPGLQIGAEF